MSFIEHPSVRQVWPADDGWEGEPLFIVVTSVGINVLTREELVIFMQSMAEETLAGGGNDAKLTVYVKQVGSLLVQNTRVKWQKEIANRVITLNYEIGLGGAALPIHTGCIKVKL